MSGEVQGLQFGRRVTAFAEENVDRSGQETAKGYYQLLNVLLKTQSRGQTIGSHDHKSNEIRKRTQAPTPTFSRDPSVSNLLSLKEPN